MRFPSWRHSSHVESSCILTPTHYTHVPSNFTLHTHTHTLIPASPPWLCYQGLSAHLVEVIALILLPVAIAMCGYSIFVFIWRSDMIAKKRVSALSWHELMSLSLGLP